MKQHTLCWWLLQLYFVSSVGLTWLGVPSVTVRKLVCNMTIEKKVVQVFMLQSNWTLLTSLNKWQPYLNLFSHFNCYTVHVKWWLNKPAKVLLNQHFPNAILITFAMPQTKQIIDDKLFCGHYRVRPERNHIQWS